MDGVGVAVTSLCKQLALMGHEVTFLTGQTSPRSPVEEEVDGYRIVRTDLFGALSRGWDPVRLGVFRGLAFPVSLAFDGHAVEKNRYDVFNAHLYTAEMAVLPLSRRSGALLVDTVHGTYAPAWRAVEANSLKRLALSGAERLLVPAAAGASALQVHAAEYSRLMALRWGAEESKLMTIYNGVDVDAFGGIPRSHGPAVRIFTARRLVKKNGLDVLIRAVSLLRKLGGLALTIAGTGPEEEPLKAMTSAFGITDRVEFVGAVPHSEIPGYLAAADVAVVPSYIEASSLFVLEAMAAGVPVVAAAVGGIPEIVRQGRDGLLVIPGDPAALARGISEVVNDGALARRLCASARRRVAERFTVGEMARRYVAAYKHALESGKR